MSLRLLQTIRKSNKRPKKPRLQLSATRSHHCFSGATMVEAPAMAGTRRSTTRSGAPTTSIALGPPGRTWSNESKYIYTDDDSQGKPLDGQNTYAITFAKGEAPPVKGVWSFTLYNKEHFFHPNPLNRYSLGTKNKNLKYNVDGSLTLHAGAKSPGADKEGNWLPAPENNFSLYIRAYWADDTILNGSWTPPAVQRVN